MARFERIVPFVTPDRRPTAEAIQWMDGVARGGRGARPEDFGAAGDGSKDDTDALNRIFAQERDIVLNGTYRITADLTEVQVTTGVLRVSGTGTIYVDGDLGSALVINAPYPTPLAVTSVTADTHTFPSGIAAGRSTEIVVTGHDAEIGDIVKIVADDAIPGSTGGGVRRVGEFGYVADVSTDTIYIGGRLVDTYTTNPRLVKIRRDARLVWDGPRFVVNSAVGDAEDWSSTLLTVRGFYRPYIATEMENGYAVGLFISSCIQADVEVTGRRFRNRVTSQGVPGYLVQDTCSFQTQARIRGTDARHVYTTITNSSTADSADIWRYGRTMGATVYGAALGSSSGAWDVHSEAANCTFIGVTSASNWLGEAAAGAGIQLRGRRTRALQSTDFGSNNGVQFYAQTSGDCIDCQLIDFGYEGPGDAVRMDAASGSVERALVRGGILRSSALRTMFLKNGEITLDSVTIVPTGSSAGTCAVLLAGNATVRVKSLTVDLSDFTGTNFRVFQADTGTTGNTLIAENVTTVGGAFQAWINANSTDLTATLIGATSDSAPTSGTAINDGSATIAEVGGLANHEARITALEP